MLQEGLYKCAITSYVALHVGLAADVRDVVPTEKNRFDCLMQSKLFEVVLIGKEQTPRASFCRNLACLRTGLHPFEQPFCP